MRGNELTHSELETEATWPTRKFMPFVMQRISVAGHVAAASEIHAPRDRTTALGEALWEVFSNSDDPRIAGLMEVFREQAVQIAREDGVWICEEAIRSLM